MRLRRCVLPTLLALASLFAVGGCTAEITGDGEKLPDGSGPTASTGVPGSVGSPEVTSPPSNPAAAAGVVQDFALPSNEVTLLPFQVRLAKVATVADVPITDPILQGLRDARYSLGDYDFANSQKPDNTWTALRISDWVRAIKPVCASPQMKARFAALPAQLPALISAAHGRSVTPEDQAAVTDNLMGLTVDDSAKYEAVCLSVLSSLEFLAQ